MELNGDCMAFQISKPIQNVYQPNFVLAGYEFKHFVIHLKQMSRDFSPHAGYEDMMPQFSCSIWPLWYWTSTINIFIRLQKMDKPRIGILVCQIDRILWLLMFLYVIHHNFCVHSSIVMMKRNSGASNSYRCTLPTQFVTAL